MKAAPPTTTQWERGSMTPPEPLPGFAPDIERTAVLSDDGRYRYRLGRRWGDGPVMCFIMLNPSTADADIDDPTIRRCIGFAKREGCDAIDVINQYAYRSTDPHVLNVTLRGPDNFAAWAESLKAADIIVAAWGAWFDTKSRGAPWQPSDFHAVAPDDVLCLGCTSSGAPRHPLYVRGDQPLELFTTA